MLGSVADLFRLERGGLLELEGFAEKSADNLLEAIERSKDIPIERFIYALGIRNVGEHVARLLAAHRGSLASLESATREAARYMATGADVAEIERVREQVQNVE